VLLKRLATLFLFFAAFAQASLPDDRLNAQQKERYHSICQKLIAPCCWRQSVDTHSSSEAEAVKTEVAAMILAGKPDRAILDSFIAKYGERILGEPEGMTWVVLTVVPVLVLFAGGVFLGWFLLRRRPAPAEVMLDSHWE
jgi:cytochrome c-type biogenesis protein CcmH/NrfF